MKSESLITGTSLRFDQDLGSFNKLVALYLQSFDDVRSSGKSVIAKDPISPPEVFYSGGVVPCDIYVREWLKALGEQSERINNDANELEVSPELSPWNKILLNAAHIHRNSTYIDAYSPAYSHSDNQVNKMFSIMAQVDSKSLRYWETPIFDPTAEKWALPYLKNELMQLFKWINLYSKRRSCEDEIRNAVVVGNKLRGDLLEIDKYLQMDIVPLAGLEYYLIQLMFGDFAMNPEALHCGLQQLLLELGARSKPNGLTRNVKHPSVRIYFMGDDTQELRLFNVIEDHGGVLVGCGCRFPMYYALMDEKQAPLDALAQWIWKMPSNLPITERIEVECESIKKQHPDAIVINTTIGDRHFFGTGRITEDLFKEILGLPILRVETGLFGGNIDGLSHQICAFIQSIG